MINPILRLQVCFFLLLATTSVIALEWSDQEIKKLKQFSVLNARKHKDPSNRFINNFEAINFGRMLFNNTQLSGNGHTSCSSCHIKQNAFTDNRVVPRGRRRSSRNTPTLLNVNKQNWFSWDGRKDSLWAQAISSIESPREQNFSRTQLFHLISETPQYKQQYEKIFRHKLPPHNELNNYPYKASLHGNISELNAWKDLSAYQKKNINLAFTNVGKAIAAYVSTIKSAPTRFDRFIKQLIRTGSSQKLNESEQKGLKIFISEKTGCNNCHTDFVFSDGEFHNIGTSSPNDNGRSEIIEYVISDDFNCLGKYSDATPAECLNLLYANTDRHSLSGTYKTPTLRSISKTAPYMHDGRYRTLYETLQHYSNVDENMAQMTDLSLIELSEEEKQNLIDFLTTL